MRRFSIILLCLLLSGCKVSLPGIPPYTTSQTATSRWKPIQFADIPECGFRVEGWQSNGAGEYECRLICHNRSDAPQLFSCEAWCVDGWQALPFWGEEVQPGEEASFLVVIPATQIIENTAQKPQSVSFELKIFSQADLRQNYLVSSHCAFTSTGERAEQALNEPLSWQQNAKVLADNRGCTMVLAEARQLPGRLELDCLLENKTRSNIMFRLFDPIFNGVETDQVRTLQLTAGAKCSQTIVFELPETAGYLRWLELEAQVFEIDEWFGKAWVDEAFCIRVADFFERGATKQRFENSLKMPDCISVKLWYNWRRDP